MPLRPKRSRNWLIISRPLWSGRPRSLITKSKGCSSASDSAPAAEATEFTRDLLPALLEGAEKFRRGLLVEADSRVLHGEPDVPSSVAGSNTDRAALGRELDRVADQIPNRLLEPYGVDLHVR